jgi:replicative DNA helicase
MKLSQPISNLKRKAKRVARDSGAPLHAALDKIAAEEGFTGWSLLASKWAEASTAAKLYATLRNGELILVGARPRQGKTMLCLAVAAEAMRAGNRSVVFTLDCNEKAVRACLLDVDAGADLNLMHVDCSDEICASYIDAKLDCAQPGTIVIVDFLQALDQKRTNPPVQAQVKLLKDCAERRGLTVLLISQIDRSYDLVSKPFPDARDIRMPNPIDRGLFNKTWFMHRGEVSLHGV